MVEDQKKKRQLKLSMPNSYGIIGGFILIAMIMTYIVPAGEFQRIEDSISGRTMVLPDSYHLVKQSPVGIFDMFINISKGMIDASQIIFFIFFAYGLVYMIIISGAFNSGVGALAKRIKGREKFIIPIFMLLFGILGATFGMYEESYGFLPLMMGITAAMGYDPFVGAVIVFVGVATGFSAAITNPFTLGVAQGISELPMFSGLGFRVIIWITFMTLVIWYTMNYAKKVKADPQCSLVKDVNFPLISGITQDELMTKELTLEHKISLSLFFITIITLIYGTIKYGWYLTEISGLFIMMMIIMGFVNGYTLSQVADIFVEASTNVAFGAFIIGISRTILIILQDGHVIDTIVYQFSLSVENLSVFFAAEGMLLIQNLLNFLIPSGSGQAATSMPLMAPLADILGVNRQIAVLAFQFGDGFSNMFWPTAVAVECGIAGIPLSRWYKFMGPLFLYMLILQGIFIGIAVMIGYGPF